ncbi:MAG: hypothetical protein ACYC0X_05070 [Pirellulaceae bacterium]
MLRRALLILLFAQFILLVAFAVLVGGYALAAATHDTSGAPVLWWTAMICLMLIVMDVLLLVGVLGISALVRAETRDRTEV